VEARSLVSGVHYDLIGTGYSIQHDPSALAGLCERRVLEFTLIVGAYQSASPTTMKLDQYQPRPSQIALLFSCDRHGTVNDLRRAIRRHLANIYGMRTGLAMAISPTYNILYNRRHTERCIILTADSSPFKEAVLLELYARLVQVNSQIQTSLCRYSVTLEGAPDHQRLHGLLMQYFYIEPIFQNSSRSQWERHLLN
jgi:hypothetical protein